MTNYRSTLPRMLTRSSVSSGSSTGYEKVRPTATPSSPTYHYPMLTRDTIRQSPASEPGSSLRFALSPPLVYPLSQLLCPVIPSPVLLVLFSLLFTFVSPAHESLIHIVFSSLQSVTARSYSAPLTIPPILTLRLNSLDCPFLILLMIYYSIRGRCFHVPTYALSIVPLLFLPSDLFCSSPPSPLHSNPLPHSPYFPAMSDPSPPFFASIPLRRNHFTATQHHPSVPPLSCLLPLSFLLYPCSFRPIS